MRSMSQAFHVRQISPQDLKAMLDSGTPLELLDVRSDAERAIAKIDRARHLDEEAADELQRLDRSTLLVFQCHHGMRSQAAAQYFLQQGFTNVCNLAGGIEAWSIDVDPSVRRY
jgi:monothiol glutaredoxin